MRSKSNCRLTRAFYCRSINSLSELKSAGKEQQLRLVFATHEVWLRGHSLRRIETAMQRMELSFLAASPGNHRSLIPDGQPVVTEIVVTDMKALEKKQEAVPLPANNPPFC